MAVPVKTERPTVYDGGFQPMNTTQPQTGEIPDLMGHLFSVYVAVWKAAHPGKSLPATQLKLIQQFVDECRAYLDANPPVSQRYIGQGIGFILQNGVTVAMKTQDSTNAPDNSSFPVSTPKSQPGQSGITETQSFPITGPPKETTHAGTQANAEGQGKRGTARRAARKSN